MMRSTHSISVRLCMPTRVSSRISAGRPMTRAKRRATLKYRPYSLVEQLRVALQARSASPATSASSSTSAAMPPVS